MSADAKDPAYSESATEAALLRDQREANEQLVLASMRAQEIADQAEAGRVMAESDRARLFEHAGWGVAFVSDEDHRLTAVNPALAHMHGYSVEELVGRGIETLCPPSAREQLAENIRLLHERGHHLFEGPHVRKDGSLFACLTEGTIAKASAGTAAASAYNFQDVSERAVLESRLAVSERLAALGTMSAGIAHEVNNPLTYNLASISHVIAELPLLLEDIGRLGTAGHSAWPAMQARADGLLGVLNEAREGAQRIERIVVAMKTFARPLDDTFKVASLPRMLEAAMRICHEQCAQRARLVQDFREAPQVDCNDGQLGQVFVNLLVNAIQAIEPGFPDDNEIRVMLGTDADGSAVVEVHDTGCGMSPETVSCIYDPFFTTKPVGLGSGLGLSISHGIVARHGGQISVESEVGRGTVFRVRLPAAKATPKIATASPPKVAICRKARVLIIDDDESVGRALRRSIYKEHDVSLASSAENAIALLESGTRFDVVFCDLMMPEMTGVEFYDWVSAHHAQLAERIVFITGGAVSPSAREFIERTGDRVMLKPFDRDQLVERIEKLMASCDWAGA